jgi:AraC-like DNA-binding protein
MKQYQVGNDVIDRARVLFENDGNIAQLFCVLAERKRDSRHTTVQRVAEVTGLSDKAVKNIFKKMQTEALGKYIMGRRFEWWYNLVELMGKI